LRRALNAGNAIFIFDGIDELRISPVKGGQEARQAQLKYFLDVVAREFAPSRVILTSRDYAYSGWRIPKFVHVRLGSFGEDQAYDLARRLLIHVDGISPAAVKLHAHELVAEMRAAVPVSLRQRPLFVSLLTGVYARRVAVGKTGLPAKPTDLYEESISLLLSRWSDDSSTNLLDYLGCDLPQLRERLEAIAYLGQGAEADEANNGGVQVDSGFSDVVLLRELVTLPGKVDYQAITGYLNRETGLLLSPSPGHYQFAHRSFQEYLAACHIIRSGPSSTEWASIPQDITNAPLAWREVFRLLGVLLVEKGRSEDLWNLVDTLLGPDNTRPQRQNDWPIWLSGAFTNELMANKLQVGRRNTPIVRDLVTAIENPVPEPHMPTVERCEMWTTRSRLRIIAGIAPAPATVDWVEIPGGSFIMGLSTNDSSSLQHLRRNGAWLPERETPAHSVDMSEFRIARFCVTRRDFAEFLRSPDGYYQDDNWRVSHLSHRHETLEETLPDPEGVLLPEIPRTGVSWFDAMAYCAWLTRRIGYTVSLPSEPQWEKAARGLDARLFPWGDEFIPDKCNSQETGLGDLSTVGAFPAEDGYWGPNGPCDMAGNVWEWCTTICETEGAKQHFRFPYDPDDGREDLDAGVSALRVVRGGCYVSQAHQVMTTFRGRDKPGMRAYRQGFRVVTSLGNGR